MPTAVVSGSFDDLKLPQVRFLEEAARIGTLQVFLWSDALAEKLVGHPPKFPQEERLYLLQAIRYVAKVNLVKHLLDSNSLPNVDEPYSTTWVMEEADDHPQKHYFCIRTGLRWQVIKQDVLRRIPAPHPISSNGQSSHKKVVVTGCFDWFHSGHVRFFEEISEMGDLYVVAGSDRNVQFLKGEGHPMFPQDERRYMVQSVRFVKEALISSGEGWVDAEPEIARIKPDIYAVNEDGDQPEKRSFCESHGIQYVVLKRTPKKGLPKRVSTDLRGF
jgi:cytidyltransferase-like protein